MKAVVIHTVTYHMHFLIWHTMLYQIIPGELPLTQLADALPDADFEWRDRDSTLVCHYPESTHRAEQVNARVLQTLIDRPLRAN